MRIVEYYQTLNFWSEANNYLVINELYLTEEARDSAVDLLSNLRKFWINVDPELPYDKENSAEIENLKRYFCLLVE